MRQSIASLAVWGCIALTTSGASPAALSQKPLGGVASAESPFTDDFDKFIAGLQERWKVPGVSIAVIDGESTWFKGYGLADVPSKTPVTPDTLFFGGSTTKAFTAASIAKIIDSGSYKTPAFPQRAVDWATPIADIIPDDFVLQDSWSTTHLTLEDALTHRTGMPRHDLSYAQHYDGHTATVKDITRSLRHLPLTEPPRTKFQYCNLMYMTASHVVETLTGQWLGDVLKDWIWEPLGMNQTFLELKDARAAGAHVATGYYFDEKSQSFISVPYAFLSSISGAGAILSSVTDYAKWVRSLIQEAGPLSKGVHKTIKAPRIFDTTEPGNLDAPTAYALAWDTTTYKGHRLWTHGGAIDSFGADVIFFPDLKFGVVSFANTMMTSNIIGQILAYKLVDDKIGIPQEKRSDWEGGWKKKLAKSKERIENAEDALFPNLPKPGLKPSLPLDSYTGTYFHPGYRNLTVELVGSSHLLRPNAQLISHRNDFTWVTTGEFEHVSSDYWIVYNYFTNTPLDLNLDFAPVQFKLGADGKVAALEVEFGSAPFGKGEGLIRFEKIDN